MNDVLFLRQHSSCKRKEGNEKVTGRKAWGLQTEEICCNFFRHFFSLLSGRRKQISVRFFSLSIYEFKKRFLLKLCVAMTPGST